MIKTITFINKTYEQISRALLTLSVRYRVVRVFRTLKNGLFSGYFEVAGYIKRSKPIAY